MRSMKINQGWDFGPGQVDLGKRLRGIYGDRKVNLPHDYMIEGDVYENAPSGAASVRVASRERSIGVFMFQMYIKSPASAAKDAGFQTSRGL